MLLVVDGEAEEQVQVLGEVEVEETPSSPSLPGASEMTLN